MAAVVSAVCKQLPTLCLQETLAKIQKRVFTSSLAIFFVGMMMEIRNNSRMKNNKKFVLVWFVESQALQKTTLMPCDVTRATNTSTTLMTSISVRYWPHLLKKYHQLVQFHEPSVIRSKRFCNWEPLIDFHSLYFKPDREGFPLVLLFQKKTQHKLDFPVCATLVSRHFGYLSREVQSELHYFLLPPTLIGSKCKEFSSVRLVVVV